MSSRLEIVDFALTDPGGGGANEKVKGDQIRDNQSAPPSSGELPLINCHTNTTGKIVKRKGYSTYLTNRLSSSGSPSVDMEEVNGLYQYTKFDGSEYEIVGASSDSTVELFDISTPSSPTSIIGASTLTSDSRLYFATVNDTLIITSEDNDTPLKWTGSGNVATLGGSPPAGKYCTEFENYAWIGNTSSNPERVFYSAITNPESWTGTDFFRLPGAFTGFGKIDNEMYLFTRNSITVIRFTGDALAPFSSDRLDTNIGCASQASVVNLYGTLYWTAGDGNIYRLIGRQPQLVTEIVPVTVGRLNKSVLSKVTAAHHVQLRQLWYSYALDSSTNNNFVVVYDYIANEIFFYDSMAINIMHNIKDSTGTINTYFGDRTGRIYLTNNGFSDNPAGVETAIDFYRYTKIFDFGSPARKKRIRTVKAVVNNQGSTITNISVDGDFGSVGGEVVSIDHDAGDTTIGEFIIGEDTLGGIDDNSDAYDVATVSKFIQLKIENSTLGVNVEVRDIIMQAQVLPGFNR